jgi:integrase
LHAENGRKVPPTCGIHFASHRNHKAAGPVRAHVGANFQPPERLRRLEQENKDCASTLSENGSAYRRLGTRCARNGASVEASQNESGRWRATPESEKLEATALDKAQIATFYEVARANGVYEFVALAASTGCRRGELLALTWADIDFVGRLMRVSKSLEQTKQGLRLKTTKNEKPREISLPKSSIEVLRAHRSSQIDNRRKFGADYRDDLNLMFAAPDGDYLKPDTMTAKICLLAKKAGLKGSSLHTLRHSHGSHLLSAGVSLPAVRKRLGHSSVYVTATVYSHALSVDEAAAGDAWDDSVGTKIASMPGSPKRKA